MCYYTSGALLTASCRQGRYGVVPGHAYSITGVTTALNGRVKLICCKNPWGRKEMRGLPWNDDSDIWRQYPEEKKRLNDRLKDDGEFWVRFCDFCDVFNRLTVSYVDVEHLSDCHVKKNKQVWSVCAENSFGLPRGTYYGNLREIPKTTFKIDRDDTQVIASFLIKNRRKEQIKHIHTGVSIFKKSDVDLRRPVFAMRKYEGHTVHENSKRVTLKAGEYVIIPNSLQRLERDFPCHVRVWTLGSNPKFGKNASQESGKKEGEVVSGDPKSNITQQEKDVIFNELTEMEFKLAELKKTILKFLE